MIYHTQKKPRDITYELLDSIFSYASTFLCIDEVNVELEFKKDLDVCGVCDHEEDSEYLIEVKESLPKEEMIRTLLHEMVHVHQIHEGYYVPGNPSIWQGEQHTGDNYYDLPWEIEAYELEETMMKNFLVDISPKLA